MATIRKEILTGASPEQVWDAVRDVGALHTRLVPGFVKHTSLEPGVRVVTFASGALVREPIITLDDASRRLVWSAQSQMLTHYNAALQVVGASDSGSRVVWVVDFLPEGAADYIDKAMSGALSVMKPALDALVPVIARASPAGEVPRRALDEEPPAREFDFWVGSWQVSDPQSGQPLGLSQVDSILGGRVLHEHWWGADGYRGESFNVFDRDRRCWHQSWVSDNGTLLLLDGGMQDGTMLLEGVAPDGARQRIRWRREGYGDVLQHWESSSDAGHTWVDRFRGLYRKRDQPTV
jgi:hypothetical protein